MWYVVQVTTGHEVDMVKQSKERVIKEGEDVFVIKAEKNHRIKGEWVIREYLLFPSYIFFETDDPADLRIRLRCIPEMTKILKTGDEFVPLYPEEEEHLRKLGGDKHYASYSEGIIVGDKLQVLDGAMKGFEGNVKKIDRHHRTAIIEVQLMGRPIEVELGLGVIKKITDDEAK